MQLFHLMRRQPGKLKDRHEKGTEPPDRLARGPVTVRAPLRLPVTPRAGHEPLLRDYP
jgi:hypothetical protein